jgi:NodT family efflux transporter outer membrane factor (OMF) lipoprotein
MKQLFTHSRPPLAAGPTRPSSFTRAGIVASLALAMLVAAGCTSPREYIRNGFKVGPEYCKPTAATANDWIDAQDRRVRNESVDHAGWWRVFNDPVLNDLVATAYQQNIPLRVAGYRILEARSLRAIAAGNIFPQTQQAFADYSHNLVSQRSARFPIPDRQFSQWDAGLNMAWELDFWGRFRRAVEVADADLDASVENYDDVLVTLVSDVASTYVDIRTFQRRLSLARANVKNLRGSFDLADLRFKNGATNEVDMRQAQSTLAQTEALVPALEIALRQSVNQLCVLMGQPPEDLLPRLGEQKIPTAPPEVAVGVPGELLRRRPDVRRAERQVAAQSARIGIAEAEVYPHIAVTGVIGVEANQFQDLFKNGASFGSVGPSLRWNILNYGRIRNNVRAQDAVLQQLVGTYQQTVLQANAEAENAIVAFLRSQQRMKLLSEAVGAQRRANDLVVTLYKGGLENYGRVFDIQSLLVVQDDAQAQAEGDVARNLVGIYRALGGGWQIRLADDPAQFVRIPESGEAPVNPPQAAPHDLEGLDRIDNAPTAPKAPAPPAAPAPQAPAPAHPGDAPAPRE